MVSGGPVGGLVEDLSVAGGWLSVVGGLTVVAGFVIHPIVVTKS